MARDPKIVSSEPTPGQLVRDLHCWIATYPDGTEGIMAGGLEGIGMTTLCSSRRRVAEAMAPMARHIAAVAANAGQPISVRLVTFTSAEGTRQ